MSQKSHKKRSYRDALTGDRNEFIGTPVMSGGKADASGASTPSREKKINSNKKQKSPKGANRAVVPETPANPPAAEAVDWDAAFDKALTVGQPELVVPAEAGNELSLTLVVTRSLPVLPEHRQEVAEFVRNWPQSDFAVRQQVAQTKPRRMVIQDLKDCFACRRDDAELLLQLSACVHGRFYAGESAPVEHHAIAMWCGKILFENDEAYSDSEWVHGEVPDDSASEVSAPDGDGKDKQDDPSADESSSDGDGEYELPPKSQSPVAVSRVLLSADADRIKREERPAFVEYVLSLQEEPSLLDVKVVNDEARAQRRRERVCSQLMSRFTISNAEAARLLQISYLVHRRFRALDDQHACEHVGFAILCGAATISHSQSVF